MTSHSKFRDESAFRELLSFFFFFFIRRDFHDDLGRRAKQVAKRMKSRRDQLLIRIIYAGVMDILVTS